MAILSGNSFITVYSNTIFVK